MKIIESPHIKRSQLSPANKSRHLNSHKAKPLIVHSPQKEKSTVPVINNDQLQFLLRYQKFFIGRLGEVGLEWGLFLEPLETVYEKGEKGVPKTAEPSLEDLQQRLTSVREDLEEVKSLIIEADSIDEWENGEYQTTEGKTVFAAQTSHCIERLNKFSETLMKTIEELKTLL